MPIKVNTAKLNLEDHLLRESFGLTGGMPLHLKGRVGKAILAVAGADGDVTSTEMTRFLGLMRAFGAPDALLEELLKFDYRGARLADVVDAETQPFARLILHDAIRVARADGFGDRERQAATRAATLLGLDPVIVPTLEGLLDVEDSVRAMRIGLLSWNASAPLDGPASAVVPGASRPVSAFERGFEDHVRRERYGLVGPVPHDFAVKVGKLVMAIAASDGELSERETTWLLGMSRAIGAPPAALEELAKFDPRKAELQRLLVPELRGVARIAVYEAINVSRQDGFAERERIAAERACEHLGIERGFVQQVEGLMLLEDALRNARMRVLSAA